MAGSPLQRFFSELKRRRVFRVAGVYAVVAYAVVQAAELLVPLLLLPEWITRAVLLLALLGFPVALVLAWAFEMTLEGVQRTDSPASASSRSRSPAYVGLGILVALVGLGAYAYWGGPDAAELDGPITSIAVLPFADLSPEGNQAYFSDGITEELLDALAQVQGLKVPARTSSFAFKDEDTDIREIARKLDVEAVLEGSVRKADDRVRITAQLIEAESGYHLWSDTYDRRLTDIFQVQDEISREIVNALRVRLTDEERSRLAEHGSESVLAYEFYLRGKERLRSGASGPMEVRKQAFSATAFFREALREDPDYAPAWAGLAQAHRGILGLSVGERADSVAAFARRAISLDPKLADGYVALGYAHALRGEYEAAEERFRFATELNPNHAEALAAMAEAHHDAGRLAEAIPAYRRAIELDPANGVTYETLAYQYIDLRLFDRAEEWLRKGLLAGALNPGAAYCHLAWTALHRGDRAAAASRLGSMFRRAPEATFNLACAGDLESSLGNYERAKKHLEQYAPTLPVDRQPLARLAYLAQKTGEPERAERLLREAEARIRGEMATLPPNRAVELYDDLARIQAVRGELDAAVASLGRFVEPVERNWWRYHGIRTEPEYESLHGYPGFEELLRRMKAELERERERVVQAGL